MRVLVVEDHEELANTLATGLRREGIAVDIALDGRAALERGLVYSYDVVVLDRDLPGVHGDEVCRRLFDNGCRARVLMLTAAGTIEDRVDGLTLGADDYLPTPFAFAERGSARWHVAPSLRCHRSWSRETYGSIPLSVSPAAGAGCCR